MGDLELWQRRFERERRARKAAEQQLESKSLELDRVNRRLELSRDGLEQRVEARTTELLAAKDAAEASSRTKSEFLANMSHELRTPMNGVLGVSSLLSASELGQDQVEYVKIITDSANSLLVLIDDILDLSKIESGKLEISSVAFDLRRCLGGVVDLMLARAREKGITLDARMASDLPDCFVGDDTRLRQILTNLIGNAIKFTEQGGVRVEVEGASVIGFPRRYDLEFRVVDTGIGIPPDRLEGIFEQFVQADASTTRRYGGTGLGLTISRELVGQMGGLMAVESEPGVGTTFCFRLVWDVAEASATQAAEQNPLTAGAKLSGRVLLAEDNPVNQLVASKMLSLLGCEVTTVADGALAIEAFCAGDFDLILMDWHMPVLSGVEATRRIRALQDEGAPRIPIVALTASAMRGDRQVCLEAGMDDYVSKPVQPARLRAVLSRWLRDARREV